MLRFLFSMVFTFWATQWCPGSVQLWSSLFFNFCVRLKSLTFTISDLADSEERTQKANQGYSRDFQVMLDSLEEEDYSETASHVSEKKRRLNLHQVKALEKNFEVENKLDPERKLKLAGELGLQPRQVAIWFQNRRARWKTKQLERDYGTLKASYEALKLDYSSLEQKNEVLAQKVLPLDFANRLSWLCFYFLDNFSD